MTPTTLTTLWEHIPDALIATDLDGLITEWSPAAEAHFGYAAAEAVGHNAIDLLVPPNYHAIEFAHRDEVLRQGAALVESMRKCKDGTLLYVIVSTKRVPDAQGAAACLLSHQQDVTSLKVQRDAKLAQTRFYELLKSAPDATIMVNDAGRIVMANQQAEKIFGQPHANLVGRLAKSLLPMRFRYAYQDRRRDFFEQPRTLTMANGMPLKGLRQDGEEFPMEISLSSIATEEGVMVMSVMRDISFRYKADQKFNDLLESAPEAMVIFSREGLMVLVNSQAVKLFGWSREELMGQRIDTLIPKGLCEQNPETAGGFFDPPRTLTLGVETDMFGQRKDGSLFPVEISLAPLDTEDGLFVSSAIRDVSERRRIEKALRDKNQQLETAARTKDRFFASMSHELRTPLNSIIGFTGTLRMQLPGPLNEEQDKQLRIVQTSARHLLSLINDLLDVAQLEADKLSLEPADTDCSALLEDTAATLRPQAEKKGLGFQVDLPAQTVMLYTDQRALQQILINLVGNAIKFTERGGVQLRLSSHTEGTRKTVRFQVEDTGPGIPTEDQGRLFEAFSRINAADRRKFEGTGLGLHLSRKLAQELGGTITCTSEYGHGALFSLELPPL